MLKLLFNKFSKIVYSMETLGLLASAGIVFKMIKRPTGLAEIISFSVFIFLYLFLRFCATFRFYDNVPRYYGIELHFKKIMVAVSYIIGIVGVVGFFFPSTALFIVGSVILAAVAHINAIFLYLHHKDNDSTPPNALTRH